MNLRNIAEGVLQLATDLRTIGVIGEITVHLEHPSDGRDLMRMIQSDPKAHDLAGLRDDRVPIMIEPGPDGKAWEYCSINGVKFRWPRPASGC